MAMANGLASGQRPAMCEGGEAGLELGGSPWRRSTTARVDSGELLSARNAALGAPERSIAGSSLVGLPGGLGKSTIEALLEL